VKLCTFEAGLDQPFFLIAGPCVIESEHLALDTAARLKDICSRLDIPFIYKSSFDKANRTSGASFRGPGMDEGLRILAEVKRQVGVPVLTDVHEDTDIAAVAEVVDVLQTPAFLCRQTNFITRVARPASRSNQERPVPQPLGDEQRGGKGPCHRQPADHGVRTRHFLRLQQSRIRHALAHGHARYRLPGGIRCNPFRAVAWRAG
jgi:hypothetical protein